MATSLVGQTVSHYTILEQLGAGGMGVVYKALDTKLKRTIALKFLPPELTRDAESRERFIHEAQAASALQHHNICTVHDIDQTADGQIFIVMDLYDGETLKQRISGGPLPIDEAIDIAVQIALGLAEAHANRIVHRDIKPANILLTRGGVAKIVDFGLAKLSGATKLTKDKITVGTVAYMSPEQARGEKVDQRTDIWSLGVVLYEMITGVPPFKPDYTDALMYAILNESPDALTARRSGVPLELERIVNKALAKEAGERYQSVDDFMVDLRSSRRLISQSPHDDSPSVRTPRKRRRAILVASALLLTGLLVTMYFALPSRNSEPEKRSIAVLTFRDLNGSRDDEIFSIGMTESVITDIARVPGLFVIARISVSRYKGKEFDVQKAGHELGVNYVLEGSVQRSGTTIRVNAQLINVATGFHLWAQKFDREVKDLFSLQDDISGHVVEALKLTLPTGDGRERRRRPTANLDAYEYYLRGRYYQMQDGRAKNDTSIAMFQEAIRLDPEFALAYSALGSDYQTIVFNYGPDRELEQKAYVAIEKALTLDPNLAEGYSDLGDLLWTSSHGFPHEQALREQYRALSLNPNLVGAHQSLGVVFLHIGLLAKGIEEFRTTLALDPTNTFSPPRIARIYWYQQKFDSALAQLERVPARYWKIEQAIALHDMGRDDRAWALLQSTPWDSAERTSTDLASVHAMLYAARGDAKEAERSIAVSFKSGHDASHFHHAQFNIACAYAILKNPSQAVAWLQKAADNGFPCYPLFANDPNLRGLKDDPTYIHLLENLRKQWEYFRSNF